MIKRILKTIFYIGSFAIVSCSQEKLPEGTIKGKYTGKNIFVQNPNNPNGIGFCVNEVVVNGKTTSDEVNSESFEIDLKGLGIKEGEEVTVQLKYSEGCAPRFLNPEALQ